MIPLQIRVGQKEWPDDGHINKQELFDEILETDVLPKSACPAPDAYLQRFDKNADRIYVITVSSALSGSYNSASLARKLWREENKGKKGQKIYIIDSKSVSVELPESCAEACGEKRSVQKILQLFAAAVYSCV